MKNWLEDFTETVSTYYDSPKIFIEGLSYFVAGSVLGRRVHVPWGKPVYPNIYMLLVSPPGWYHKSEPTKTAIDVIVSTIGNEKILPNNASSESFVNALNKNVEGVLYEDEFKSFIDSTRREYSSEILTTVMKIFQPGTIIKIARVKKGKEGERENTEIVIDRECILSFISTTQEKWLMSKGRVEDISTGFLGRFLIIEGKTKEKTIARQPFLANSVIEGLAFKLKVIIRALDDYLKDQGIKSAPIELSSDAERLYDEIYEKIENAVNVHPHEEFASFSSRIPTYTAKLAMINAVINRRLVIEKHDIENAYHYTSRAMNSISNLLKDGFHEDRYEAIEAKAIKHIKGCGGECTRRDLLRKLRVKSSAMNEVVETLLDKKMIKMETKTLRGERSVRIKLLQDSET